MLTPASGAERVLWILLIVLVAGYFGGTWLNRRRSRAIGQWLQASLGSLGGRVAWRWIKAMNSGAEVTVAEARAPFQQLTIAYYLLTREFAPLWGIEMLRGKRDLLSVRAELRRQPSQEFDVVPSRGSLRRQIERAEREQPRTWREMPAGLLLAAPGGVSEALVRHVEAFLGRYGPSVQRLSLRRRQPHLVVFLELAGPETGDAVELWRALGEMLRDQPR